MKGVYAHHWGEPQTEKGHRGTGYISSYLLSDESSGKSARTSKARPNFRSWGEKTKMWDALGGGRLKTISQPKSENRTENVE
jgi:hypothetical protein